MERVFIGLGGNQGDTVLILKQAIQQIAHFDETEMVAVSSFYLSPAWGGIEQAAFTNAVLEIRTTMQPEALLHTLLELERHFGRNRTQEVRWGPRRLDCDILLYGNYQLNTQQLIIPHPRLTERAFVLLPLFELDPKLFIAEFGTVSELLNEVADQMIKKID
jgi:2-amino-4-hydroxy-6-hydroxymethyldihydropteridine diphosphokinase